MLVYRDIILPDECTDCVNLTIEGNGCMVTDYFDNGFQRFSKRFLRRYIGDCPATRAGFFLKEADS